MPRSNWPLLCFSTLGRSEHCSESCMMDFYGHDLVSFLLFRIPSQENKYISVAFPITRQRGNCYSRWTAITVTRRQKNGKVLTAWNWLFTTVVILLCFLRITVNGTNGKAATGYSELIVLPYWLCSHRTTSQRSVVFCLGGPRSILIYIA